MAYKYSLLIDTCARLYDLNFVGYYGLEPVHEEDFYDMVNRAWQNGLKKIIIPAGSLFESVQAHSIHLNDERIHYTVGCHPRCYYKEYRDLVYKSTNYPQEMADFYEKYKGAAVAYGDFGLDYERIYLCPRELQLQYFKEQLDVAQSLNAPLYLDCRGAFNDFMDVLRQRRRFRGVVHSFKGTEYEANGFLELGLHIGIDASIFKTEEGIDVLKKIPISRLVIATQSPNYEASLTYAGFKYVKSKFETVRRTEWSPGKMVKFRNEPAKLCQVLEMLAVVREYKIEDLENILHNTTMQLFFRNI